MGVVGEVLEMSWMGWKVVRGKYVGMIWIPSHIHVYMCDVRDVRWVWADRRGRMFGEGVEWIAGYGGSFIPAVPERWCIRII